MEGDGLPDGGWEDRMLITTVCVAVSAAGLGLAALTAFRKRFWAATRITAYALIPIGLVMTGVINWVTGLAFDPTVWAGFGVLGLAAVLFKVAHRAERRRERRHMAGADAGTAVDSRTGGALPPTATRKGEAADSDDFSDIQAILKKHGI